MHRVQELPDGLLQPVQGRAHLLAGVPAGNDALALLHVLGADLHPEGHALHLILGELPAGGVVGIVHPGADARLLQPVPEGRGGVQHAGLVRRHGDDHRLDGSHPGGQDQAVVVSVGHDDAADHPGGHAPAGLVGIVELVVLSGVGDVEGFGEAVAEVVAGARLEGLVVVHHALHGVGFLRAVELLLLRLPAPEHGHGQEVLHKVRVDVQHPHGLFPGLLLGGVHGVALLPEELPVAEEGAGGLLPAEDAAPLVIELGQVPPGVDDVGVMLAEEGLGGGADGQAVLQLLAAAHGDPGALGGEALHMVLLLLEQGLGNQHGEVYVFVPGLLKAPVQLALYVLPNGVAVGAVNEHALDGAVVDELRFLADVGVPLGEILVPGGDGVHLPFIHSHSVSVPFRI